jgi:uncharacterized protein (DUF3084 family)
LSLQFFENILILVKNLAPKLLALQDAEARLRIAKRQLQTVMDELAAQQAELNRMKKEFDTALQEKQKVQEEAEYTRNRYLFNRLITSFFFSQRSQNGGSRFAD